MVDFGSKDTTSVCVCERDRERERSRMYSMSKG